MSRSKQPTPRQASVSLGDLLSMASMFSEFQRTMGEQNDERQYQRAPTFGECVGNVVSGVLGFVAIGLVVFLIVTMVTITYSSYHSWNEQVKGPHKEMAAEPEYASPTKKQYLSLAKKTIMKKQFEFVDEYGYEVTDYDGEFATAERNGKLVGGFELKDVLRRNASMFRCRDLDAFIDKSLAAVSGEG